MAESSLQIGPDSYGIHVKRREDGEVVISQGDWVVLSADEARQVAEFILQSATPATNDLRYFDISKSRGERWEYEGYHRFWIVAGSVEDALAMTCDGTSSFDKEPWSADDPRVRVTEKDWSAKRAAAIAKFDAPGVIHEFYNEGE